MGSLVPNPGVNLLSTQIKAFMGATYKVHLFTNQVIVNSATVKDDLVEAAFAGYAAAVPGAMTDDYIDPVNGGFSCQCPSVVFTPTAVAAPPITVHGWYITKGVGDDLVACGNLVEPWVIDQLPTALPIAITFNFQN